jgi:hypothetical protein
MIKTKNEFFIYRIYSYWSVPGTVAQHRRVEWLTQWLEDSLIHTRHECRFLFCKNGFFIYTKKEVIGKQEESFVSIQGSVVRNIAQSYYVAPPWKLCFLPKS